MRHDPRRLSQELYPLRRAVIPLFGDVDSLGHVNNVAIARYFEQARVLVMEELTSVLGGPAFERAVLARIEIDYLAEVFYPHEVMISTGVLKVGTSSMILGSALFQHGRCVALATSVDVGTQPEGGAAPISDEVRVVLDKYLLDLPA